MIVCATAILWWQLRSSTLGSKTYGPPGNRFELSFPHAPDERTIAISQPLYQAQYGTAVAQRWIWRSATFHDVVWVDHLTGRPPGKRLDPFLRSYLPSAHGGRIVQRFTMPAAIETVPCSTPAGACPGIISAFVVLDGRTLYEVMATGSLTTDQAVIASFQPR